MLISMQETTDSTKKTTWLNKHWNILEALLGESQHFPLCCRAEAAAWTEDKNSHLDTWDAWNQDLGMRALCLITSCVDPVKVVDVSWFRKQEFVLVCVLYGITMRGQFLSGENTSEAGQGWGNVFLALMGSRECHGMLVLWMSDNSILHATLFISQDP